MQGFDVFVYLFCEEYGTYIKEHMLGCIVHGMYCSIIQSTLFSFQAIEPVQCITISFGGLLLVLFML